MSGSRMLVQKPKANVESSVAPSSKPTQKAPAPRAALAAVAFRTGALRASDAPARDDDFARRFSYEFSKIPANPPDRAPIQDPCPECEQKAIRRNAVEGSAVAKGDAAAHVESAVSGGGQPLPAPVRTFMEPRFAHDFSRVRVHAGPAAAASAAALGARAFTIGSNVVFGASSYEPGTIAGRRLLAHELAHVVQAARCPPLESAATEPLNSGAEREAHRAGGRAALGLTVGALTEAHSGIALTPTSDQVRPLLSYSVTDLAVTASDERNILALLRADPDLSATVRDLDAAGMLDALLDRVDEPVNRRDLLRLLGERLNPAARGLVEPKLQQLDLEHPDQAFQLQYNLGRLGVTGSPAFNHAPYGDLITGNAMAPFTGSGATGVIPTDRGYTDLFRAGTSMVDAHINPIPGSLGAYLSTLSPDQRRRQAELLLLQPIATNRSDSYAGWLPSRLQVIRAASAAQNLEWELVAAIILAEQRDQSRVEDARDFIGGAVFGRNTSIGLGQVTVSTARRQDLFADLLGNSPSTLSGVNSMRGNLMHEQIVRMLASDEFNIVAVARYLRILANGGATKTAATLPLTQAAFPAVNFPAYANHSSTWPEDNVAIIGMYYTSRPWTDDLRSQGWGWFVRQAYRDVKSAALP